MGSMGYTVGCMCPPATLIARARTLRGPRGFAVSSHNPWQRRRGLMRLAAVALVALWVVFTLAVTMLAPCLAIGRAPMRAACSVTVGAAKPVCHCAMCRNHKPGHKCCCCGMGERDSSRQFALRASCDTGVRETAAVAASSPIVLPNIVTAICRPSGPVPAPCWPLSNAHSNPQVPPTPPPCLL